MTLNILENDHSPNISDEEVNQEVIGGAEPVDQKERLSKELVLAQSDSCTVRRQENQYLLYNQKTDELHLLPNAAYFVYNMFDGKRSFGFILSAVLKASYDPEPEVHIMLGDFVLGLIKRGLLVAVSKHDS